jgi:membrane protease YdiL (CAAX protease family)
MTDGARSGAARSETAIVLALTALLTIVPLVPLVAAAPLAVAILALTVLAWRRRAPSATSLGVLAAACVVLGVVGVGPQQVVFPLAFALYAVVVRRVLWLHGAAAWFRRGALNGGLLVLAVGIAAISGIALLAWHEVARPDLQDLVRAFVPDLPIWLLVPGALVFALLNAAIEEGAYRGVALAALDVALGPGLAAIVLQAMAFGALHVHGFPRGATGVGLACLYGLALGALRRRAGGLLAPWIAHVLTDLVVAGIVLALALG